MTEGRGKPKAILAWSSGKDSAYALHGLRRAGEFNVVGLLTTVTDRFARVSMHGVREDILESQATRAGLPLVKVRIPSPCPNEAYEDAMAHALRPLTDDGVRYVAFGDLFLEDIRAWRVERLAKVGMEGVFPLWGRNTHELAREMISAGMEARIVCLDPRKLAPKFAGHRFDHEFLESLPPDIDPCGEYGEFHTLALGGPMFSSPLRVKAGSVVQREGFVFADFER